jgi:gliding motility-associated-like protein
VYPLPTVSAPNIFTPNDDGINDVFYLKSTNTVRIELIILNRWGIVLYEGSGIDPAWDGTSSNGNKANEGTYFYKYIATGPGGDTKDGQGFVQLILY